jgi:glucose/mannose-6-phosphate isomerase
MINLDNLSIYEKYDKTNLYSIIMNLPEQIEQSLRIMDEFPATASISKSVNNIILAGMGGSGISGNLIKSYLSYELQFPLEIINDYILPEYVNQQTLFIPVSYSGNTNETLATTKIAKQRNATIIGICSGGKLEEELRSIGFVIKIPANLPPRHSLGYLFSCLVILLEKIGIIPSKISSLIDLVAFLINFREKLEREIDTVDNFAKQIAVKLRDRIPIIYTNNRIGVCAKRWKTQLNENSKHFAKYDLFPELTHNEIVSWERLEPFKNYLSFVLLRDFETESEIRDVIKYSIELIKDFNIIEIHSVGNSLLERIFSLIYMADFVSYYLAILNEVDPLPIKNINYIKNQISKSKNTNLK